MRLDPWRIAIAAAVAWAVVLTAHMAVFAFAPFPGFFVTARGAVSLTIGSRGLAPLRDRVVAVDGTPVESGGDIRRLLDRRSLGDSVRIRFLRDESDAREESFVLRAPGLLVLRSAWMIVLAAWTHLALGVFAFWKRARLRAVRLTLLYCLVTALGLLDLASASTSHAQDALHLLVVAAWGTTLFGMGGLFLQDAGWRRYRILWAGWGVIFFGLLYFVGYDYQSGWLWAYFLSLLGGSLAALLLGLGWSATRGEPGARRQAGLVLWGLGLTAAVTIAWSVTLVLAAQGGQGGRARLVSQLLFFSFFVFFPSCVVYAIVRHQLFDFRVIVRRTLVYAILSLLLVATYFGGTAVMNVTLVRWLEVSSELAVVLVCAALSVALLPTRALVQRTVDRLFFRERLDRERVASDFTAEIVTLSDHDRATGELLSTLERICHPTQIGLWLARPGTNELVRTNGRAQETFALAEVARLGSGPLWDLGEAAGSLPERLRLDGYQVLVPLALRSISLGFVALGPRRSDLPYGSEERRLVVTVTSQAALALYNSLLLRQKEQSIAQLEALGAAMESANLQLLRAQSEIRALSVSAARGQEEERRRLAQVIHDGAGQLLAALRLHLDDLGEGGVPPREKLPVLLALVQRLADDLRALSHDLRPAALDRLGLVEALRDLAEGMTSGTLAVEVDVEPEVAPALPDDATISLYRVAQTALANVARHARANRAWIRLRTQDRRVTLEVEDDGAGFDPAALGAHAGIGLVGMRERAIWLGGSFAVDSGPGRGTRIRVDVPVPGGPS